MIMMMRESSETLPAPHDGSVSSTFPTLRGLGCEARVSTSVSDVRNGGDGRLTWKTGRKRRPRGSGHGRARWVGTLDHAVGSCPPWRRPPRSNGRIEDWPWQPTAEDGIYHQTHQSSKTDDLRATKRGLPLISARDRLGQLLCLRMDPPAPTDRKNQRGTSKSIFMFWLKPTFCAIWAMPKL
jgi:hypothetical protein